MSMNLHITAGCEDIFVYQTPTHITYMCMMDGSGKVAGELKGAQAMRAIACYIEWVKSRGNGVYKSHKEAEEIRRDISEHIAHIKSATKNIKAVSVYYV